MGKTSIEWTDDSWNPVRGCSKISPGCKNCYAATIAARFSDPGQPFHGYAVRKKNGAEWTGRVSLLDHDKVAEPLRWRRPRRVFVNSTSDLFHEDLPDGDLDEVFATMLVCCLHGTRGGHTFQILTKRAERMRLYAEAAKGRRDRIARYAGRLMEDSDGWHDAVYEYVRKFGVVHPLIWMGVSVEDQPNAERLNDLVLTPAAVRFVSVEPQLGPVSLAEWLPLKDAHGGCTRCGMPWSYREVRAAQSHDCPPGFTAGTLHLVIVGGESGRRARPFDPSWARSIVSQCREAGVACFVKQMGSTIHGDDAGFSTVHHWIHEDGSRSFAPLIGPYVGQRPDGAVGFRLCDEKGGDMAEWPVDLRVREFPRSASC